MRITVEIPDKISHRDTRIASMEPDRKALKARMERKWRKYLHRYRPLNIPIRCEFCAFVGEAQWHCHNKESAQHGINVQPQDTCSKWSPNQGLIMLLWRAWREEQGPAL